MLNFNRDILINGDCQSALSMVDNDIIPLIMTSPPYADQRKSLYGGVKADKYVEWFMPIAQEMYRVLAQDGSLIINIKEKVVDGERHTYVLELIIAMKKIGFRWVDEYIWNKTNSFPGKWNNRFRDAYERCLHFTKQAKFNMYQESVMIPIGDWKEKRFKKHIDNDYQRQDINNVGNRNGSKRSNWKDRDMVYPTNVITLPTTNVNKGHPATYPKSLPSWFIKLFTKEGDIVLDPFVGSGTTLVACQELNRRGIGIELSKEYIPLICKNVNLSYFETKNGYDLYINESTCLLED